MTSEILLIALTIYMEAAGEPWAGKVMVGDVIVNRARASSKSLTEVCKAPKQFSAWNNPRRAEKLMGEIKASKHRNDQVWRDCKMIAEMICRPGYKTTTLATHYCNFALCSPRWAKSMKTVAKVGKHTFFSEK